MSRDDYYVSHNRKKVYLPPHRMKNVEINPDESSEEHQLYAWEALRKGVNSVINKINEKNIVSMLPEIFQVNLVRGRGLFCKALLTAQVSSPSYTDVFCSLVAVVNTKIPEIGDLLLKRVVDQFRKSFKLNNKAVAVSSVKFIAHLVNQQVAHEIVALQILTLLLEKPSEDSVEVAINFLKECGAVLEVMSPTGTNAIYERLIYLIHENLIEKRIQYQIESLLDVRRSKYREFPTIKENLDLVEVEDQVTHEISIDDTFDCEYHLDTFQYDKDYSKNESLYNSLFEEIMDLEEEAEDLLKKSLVSENPDSLLVDGSDIPSTMKTVEIVDLSEQDLTNLRKSLYLVIMNSLSSEECAHKILKLSIPKGHEVEVCRMLVECCGQEKSFIMYYAQVAQKFCFLSRDYQDAFSVTFASLYSLLHTMEMPKIRNIATFFSHLLRTDALPWTVLEVIRLTEADTTPSSRIFIKTLFQQLEEYMGLAVLRDRVLDPYMAEVFSGILPRDSLKNTRFAINFFTSIGLGALTDDLRAFLSQETANLQAIMEAEALGLV